MAETLITAQQGDPFKEITTITSPYYEKYQLRPYNPAELFQKFGSYRIFDEMRTDDQISAILELKKNLIINSGYQIVSDSEEIAEFITQQLEAVDFEQRLYEILSGFDYGFSLTEITFASVDSELGPLIGLGSLKTRAPHSFEFKQDDSGQVIDVKQYGGKDGDIHIDYDKFLHYINGPEFDNPYGNSEMNRGVYTAWWSKKAIIKFWNIYLERFGAPLAVAKYDPAKTNNLQQGNLEDVLNNISAKTSIKIPNTIELDFIEATKGGEGFERAIDKYNMLIARKMLVPDLMGLAGSDTGGGSYALGGIQQKTFLQTLERPRRQLSRLINNRIVKPLLDWNWNGAKADFVFKPMSEDYALDKVKMVFDAFQKGGLVKNDADEKWIREIIGMPDMPEPEPPAAPGGEEPLAGLDPSAAPTGDEDELNGMVEPTNPPIEPAVDGEELNTLGSYALKDLKYDKKTNYKKIEAYLDQSQAKLVESLGAVVKASVNKLVSEIKAKNIVGKSSLWAINKLQLKDFDQFRVLLKRGLKDALNQGRSDGAEEAGTQKKNIIDISTSTIDAEEYVNDLASNVSSLNRTQILEKVKMILRNGIQAGKSLSQILADIDESLKGWDISSKRETATGDEVSANQLETIVRTNLTNTYNEGRQEYFDSIPDLITGYEFSAIMDGRTSERCSQLHGTIIRTSEARQFTPPMHYNCRSVLIPITAADETPTFTPKDDIPPKAASDFK